MIDWYLNSTQLYCNIFAAQVAELQNSKTMYQLNKQKYNENTKYKVHPKKSISQSTAGNLHVQYN